MLGCSYGGRYHWHCHYLGRVEARELPVEKTNAVRTGDNDG